LFVIDNDIHQRHDAPMQHLRRLGIVLAVEAAGLACLVHLGSRPWLHIEWSDLGSWLDATPTEDAVVAAIWLAALLCAGWLAGSTLLYIAALVTRIRTVIRSISWITLPGIRRMSEGALAAVLLTAPALPGSAGAQTPPPVVVVVDEDGALLPPGITLPEPERVPPLPTLPPAHRPPDSSNRSPLPTAVADDLPDVDEDQHSGTTRVIVQKGDNLWSISRRHLASVKGSHPSNDEIAPYWRQVIAVNRPSIISGNPDLIYPGEVLTMPASD
jgi:hypothetical protein